MKEQWIAEAERNARYLAKELYERIINEADDIYVDRKWYYEKVIHYMTAEGEK